MAFAELASLTPEELAALEPEDLELFEQIMGEDSGEWELHTRQQIAEDASHDVDELLYGGAAGGGKTEWLLWHAYQLCLQHPKHTVLMLRRTLPDLEKSIVDRSLERFSSANAIYLVGKREWRFRNGSKIVLGYCQMEEDVRQYLSREYDLIVFEELTDFTQRQYRMIVSRCRTTEAKRARGIHPHVVSATNPGGVGHTWVKNHFVIRTDYGKKVGTYTVRVQGKTRERRIAFVPAKVSDNPSIDQDYVFNLATLDDTRRRQLLEGDWDTFEGQYFPEFDRAVHVVEPFEIPESWTRIRGYDYGYTAPYCCLWGAIDWDGNIFIYREAYSGYLDGQGNLQVKSLTASEQGRQIVERSVMAAEGDREGAHEKIAYTVADPSIFSKTGTGVSIASMLRAAGLVVKKAMNARIDGWNRVRDFLRGSKATRHPYLRIFASCHNLIRTLPEMLHDDDSPEDLDSDLEDHACLVGDTPILTARGDIALSDVRAGDLVWTRRGWRPVIAAGCTNPDTELVRVATSVGTLTGTKDHLVNTHQGWRQLGDLTPSDTLRSWIRSSSPTPSSPTEASATTAVARTFSAEGSAFIRWSTEIISDQSRPVSTSITTTKIAPTTGPRTLWPGMPTAISPSTLESALLLDEPRPRAGLPPVRPRTPDSLQNSERERRVKAGKASRAHWLPVWSAALRSLRRSRPEPVIAVVLARPEPAGRGSVYNLLVDRDPEFVAAGVLVHNCDALRYLLMSRPRKPHRETEKGARDVGFGDIDEVLRERERGKNHDVLGAGW